MPASYYRLLMTTGTGLNKKDVFQDFYKNGNLRAEGGYSFVDLGNDRNTIFNGEVTTYYKNGKEKWHGKYVNGKREGYFTLQLREGGVAVVQFKNGKSVHDYFMVNLQRWYLQRREISLKSRLTCNPLNGKSKPWRKVCFIGIKEISLI